MISRIFERYGWISALTATTSRPKAWKAAVLSFSFFRQPSKYPMVSARYWSAQQTRQPQRTSFNWQGFLGTEASIALLGPTPLIFLKSKTMCVHKSKLLCQNSGSATCLTFPPVKVCGWKAAKRGSRLRMVIWIRGFLLALYFSTHRHTWLDKAHPSQLRLIW